MKNLLFMIIIVFSMNAHAGFLTGAVVGYAVGSSNQKSDSPGVMISSDKHDVIACRQTSDQGFPDGCEPDKACTVPNPKKNLGWWDDKNIVSWCPTTVEEFVKLQGYTKIYKRGVQFIDNRQYIILEVGK
jgi:hypothetical protein